MDFFTGAFATLITLGGYAMAAILFIVAQFDKARREREQADDATASRLITNLKTTTELQEKEMERMRGEMASHKKERDEEIKGLTEKVNHMGGRNAVLEDLFKGRDPAMQVFLKDAPTLIALTKETNELAKGGNKSLDALTATLTRFVEALPHPPDATIAVEAHVVE